LFKRGSNILAARITSLTMTMLWYRTGRQFFLDIKEVETVTDADLLVAIKQLAVIDIYQLFF